MTFRIFLILSLSMILAPMSFAQIGSLEEAIEAGITGEDPEYIADAMFELNRKIHLFVSDKNMHDPTQKRALWHTMRVVMCAIYAAGRNAAESVVGDSARIASEYAALGTARNFLLWSASFDTEDHGFEESLLAASKIARPMIFNVARDQALEVIEDFEADYSAAIASRITEWVALNVLLEEFDVIVSPVYDNALDALYPFSNPFRNAQFFADFYRERFGNVDFRVIHILAPWLIHIVPLNLAGMHRRRFESFIGGTNRPRRPPAPVDVPVILQAAAQILDDLHPLDIMDLADYPEDRIR